MDRTCECNKCDRDGPWKGNPEECFVCWSYWLGVRKQKQPDLFKKISNFAKALTKHAISGFKKTSDADYKVRLQICETCPFNKEGQCSQCGCNLRLKASFASEDCPLSKWPKLPGSGGCGCGHGSGS